jgi:hypothetical protein
MIAGGSVLTLAGCTGSTASDESQRSEEIGNISVDGDDVPSEPSPISQSGLAGTALPDGPPDWIETNMDFSGYYDANAYMEPAESPYGVEYKDWNSYFMNFGGYAIDVVYPGGEERQITLFERFWYHHGGTSPIEISVVGSSAELRAYNPGSQNHEVWFSGALGTEHYWVGLI